MTRNRLVLFILLPLFFSACSMQGPKALAFFSNLDRAGHWKTHPKTDFEHRILLGDVQCVSDSILVADTISNTMVPYQTRQKCWDKNGIETMYEVKDSTGKVLFSMTSRTEDGYLVERHAEAGDSSFNLTLIKNTENGDTVHEYQLQFKNKRQFSETNYKVSFHLDKDGKIDQGGIYAPFKQEFFFDYDKNDSLISIATKNFSKYNQIEFTYDSATNKLSETAVTYNGKLYSYKLEKFNSAGKVIELYYTNDIILEQEHTKYTYNSCGSTLTIESGGIKRKEIYEQGILRREDYIDYGGKIRLTALIETDSLGNISKSTYKSASPKANNGLPLRIHLYSYIYLKH